MSGRRRIRALGCSLLCLCACDPAAGPDPAIEITNELRAIRTLLGEQASAPVAERAALTEALRPLQEAVQALVREQATLNQQQLALTTELGRWSTLLSATVGQERAEELRQMQAALAALAAEMQAQDARHQETEALVQKALTTTVTQIEAFLQRVEALRPVRSDANPREAGPEAPATGGDQPQPTGGPPSGPGNATPRRTSFLQRRGGPGPWFYVALLGGIGAGAALLWRLIRPSRVATALAERSWPTIADGPAAAFGALRLPGATTADPAGRPVECRWRCRARDPERARTAVLARLRKEARVLQKPAPSCVALAEQVEVTLALLPGLLPGESVDLRALLTKIAADA